jgi:hypothetical protein
MAEDTSFKEGLSHVSGDTSFRMAEDTSFKEGLSHVSGGMGFRMAVQ